MARSNRLTGKTVAEGKDRLAATVPEVKDSAATDPSA
jgi:hypothetical protein